MNSLMLFGYSKYNFELTKCVSDVMNQIFGYSTAENMVYKVLLFSSFSFMDF